MATYTWKCLECERVQEVLRKMADYLSKPDDCSACGARNWERYLEGSAINTGDGFKGSPSTSNRPITPRGADGK